MGQNEPTTEQKTTQPAPKEAIPPTKELFTQLTHIEPTPEQENHTQLKAAMGQRAEEMLKPWVNLGLVSQTEATTIKQTWNNAITLNNSGMEQFGQYHSEVFETAAKELSAMDKEGTNPEIQDLVSKANTLVESIKLTSKQAGALTFRPNPLQTANSGLTETPPAFILINTDKIDPQNAGMVNAAAFEESAHLVSKLPQYGHANRKWLEETMARVVAFGTDSAHQAQDTSTRDAAAEVLRFKDYELLFRMVNRQVGDNGETLTRMFFGREPINSPLVRKVETAVQSVDMIAQIIDAGVSVDDLLKQSKS